MWGEECMKQQYVLGKYTRVVVREEDAILGAGSKQILLSRRENTGKI